MADELRRMAGVGSKKETEEEKEKRLRLEEVLREVSKGEVPTLPQFPSGEAGEAGIAIAAAPIDKELEKHQKRKANIQTNYRRKIDRLTDKAAVEAEEIEKDRQAEEKRLAKKYPVPSGLEQGLAFVTGGLSGALGGTFTREAAALKARKSGMASYESGVERQLKIMDAAKKARRDAAASSGKLTGPQETNLGKLLRGAEVSRWMTPEQEVLFSKENVASIFAGVHGKNPKKSLMLANTLAGIYDDAKIARDAAASLLRKTASNYTDEVTGMFKDPKNPDGSSMFPAGSWDLKQILKGMMDNQSKIRDDQIAQIRKGQPIAETLLIGIHEDLGWSPEQARVNIAGMMKDGKSAYYYTDPQIGMPSLRDLRSALSAHKGEVGRPWVRDGKIEAQIIALKARNDMISGLIEGGGLDKERNNKLLAEHKDNIGEIATLQSKTLVADAAEIKAITANLKADKLRGETNRAARIKYLRQKDDADVREFGTIVPKPILDAQGGRELFVEVVTLDKGGSKVVEFDPEKHQIGESWERIIPSKRHDALTYYFDRIVKTFDPLTEQPRTYSDIKKSILDAPEKTREEYHGGSIDDVRYFRETQNVKVRKQDLERDGRLGGDSRKNLIEWVRTSRDARNPKLIKYARMLLIPEEDQLRNVSKDYSWRDWNKIETRDELLNILEKTEREPELPPRPGEPGAMLPGPKRRKGRVIDISKLPAAQQEDIKKLAPGKVHNHPDGSKWKVVGGELHEIIEEE